MIPPFVDAGFRVIAPDMVGFGRSDKPTRREDYTYAHHVQWMSDWLESMDLNDVTLFCQDWGGLIGLRMVAAYPDRFARVVAANTALPDQSPIPDEAGPAMHKVYDGIPVVQPHEIMDRFRAKDGPPGFFFWRKYCAETPNLDVSRLMSGSGRVDPEVLAAYAAPFPDESYMAGARQFPSLVPIFPDDPELPANRKAWEVLEKFEKPFLTAFADGDPVTAGMEVLLQKRIPGARNRTHPTIANAGHFLQEDQGEVVAAEVLKFIAST
jgi:haloalkane dehalogenase